MSEWQPIETAPRDGTRILVAYKSYANRETTIETAFFDKDDGGGQWIGYFSNCLYALTNELTHWMPLPEPPPLA